MSQTNKGSDCLGKQVKSTSETTQYNTLHTSLDTVKENDFVTLGKGNSRFAQHPQFVGLSGTVAHYTGGNNLRMKLLHEVGNSDIIKQAHIRKNTQPIIHFAANHFKPTSNSFFQHLSSAQQLHQRQLSC